MTTHQIALFGPADTTPEPSQPPTAVPPSGRGSRGRGASPAVATDVLDEIADQRYWTLDGTDTVLVLVDDDQVRKAADEDLICHLMSIGLVEVAPHRDTVTCRYGAVRRPVTPLRLTRRGRQQLSRWRALKPLAPDPG